MDPDKEHDVSPGEKPEPEKLAVEPTWPDEGLSVTAGGITRVVDGAVVWLVVTTVELVVV